MTNNNNEILFWKIFKNKYLFNYILNNNDDCNFNYNNENDNKDNIQLKEIIKFKNLKNLEWFLKKKQFKLLKDKLLNNQYLNIDKKSILSFFKICKDDKELIEILFNYLKNTSSSFGFIKCIDNLLEVIIISNNLEALKFILNNQDYFKIIENQLNSNLLLISYQYCDGIEIIKYLINFIIYKYSIEKRNSIYNSRVKENSILYILKDKDSENQKVKFEFLFNDNELYSIPFKPPKPSKIIQTNTPIIYPTKDLIQIIESPIEESFEKIPYSIYSQCNFKTRKLIIKHSMVSKRRTMYQPISYVEIENKESEQVEIIDELLLKIDELFQTYHKKYLVTPQYILDEIKRIQEIYKNDIVNQVRQLKRILVIESNDFDSFINYYQQYGDFNDILPLDKMDFQLNHKFLRYIFTVLDTKGLLYFTTNHIEINLEIINLHHSIYNTKDYFLNSITIGEVNYKQYQIDSFNNLLKNNNKNGIIEFIKTYYNQDLIKYEKWILPLFNFLLFSNDCTIEFLNLILTITESNFAKKLATLLNDIFNPYKMFQPFNKYKWFIELLLKYIKPIDYQVYNKEILEFYSIEQIDFIFENNQNFYKIKYLSNDQHQSSDTNLNSILLKFSNLEIANYFKCKFQFLPNEFIYKQIFINSFCNCDIETLKQLYGIKFTFVYSTLVNNFKSKKDAILLFNYFYENQDYLKYWGDGLFLNLFTPLLLFIFNKSDSTDDEQQQCNLSELKPIYFKNEKLNLIKLLNNFIKDFNLPLVKFILSSFLLNNDYNSIGSLSEFTDFYKASIDIKLNKIIEMIHYLINNLPISNNNKFNYNINNQAFNYNSLFNHLYKVLIMHNDVTFNNHIIPIRSLISKSKLNIEINDNNNNNSTFYTYYYLSIKSKFLKKYIHHLCKLSTSNGKESFDILKLNNNVYQKIIDPYLNSKNQFTFYSIFNSNNINQLYFKIRSNFSNSNYEPSIISLKTEIPFLLSNFKFNELLEILKQENINFNLDYTIIKLILKIQNIKIVKEILEYCNFNESSNSTQLINLLKFALQKSNLSIVSMFLESSITDLKYKSIVQQVFGINNTILTDQISNFYKTDYQVLNYLITNHNLKFGKLITGDKIQLNLFESSFLNGSIEICQLLLNSNCCTNDNNDFIIRNDMIKKVIKDSNSIYIIKYYYKIGKISLNQLISNKIEWISK